MFRFRVRKLSRASLRSREACSREREGEEFKGKAPLSVSWPGLDPGDSLSDSGRLKSSLSLSLRLDGDEGRNDERRGRFLGGRESGRFGLVPKSVGGRLGVAWVAL